MPKADLTFSTGALHADAVGPLTERLTGLLLHHRGLADTIQARSNVWWFVNERPAYVAGAAPALPLVVVSFAIIAGGMESEQIAALIAEGTRAVKEVNPEARVWLVVEEVRGGSWGVEGRVARLAAPAAA